MNIIRYFLSKNYRNKFRADFYDRVEMEEKQKDSIYRAIIKR
jgi:hypothetical protein